MAVVQGITYNVSEERIEIAYNGADDPKGLSFTDPYTLQDIYDTDVDGGWGVVSKVGSMFIFDSVGIRLVSSAIYFEIDEGITLFFTGVATVNQYAFYNVAHLRIGGDSNFVQIIRDPAYTSAHWLYRFSCRQQVEYAKKIYVFNFTYVDFGDAPMTDIRGDKCYYFYLSDGDTMTDIALSGSNLWASLVTGVLTNISIIRNAFGVFLDGYYDRPDLTFYGLKISDCTYDYRIRCAYDRVFNMIDCSIDIDKYQSWSSGYGLGIWQMNLKTTFNTAIENGDGAALTIEDKDGNIVYSETLSGEDMIEQEITYANRRFQMDGAAITLNEKNIFEPFNLKLTKTGYQTLEIPDINIGSGVPTTIRGKMVTVPVWGGSNIFPDRLEVSKVGDKMNYGK